MSTLRTYLVAAFGGSSRADIYRCQAENKQHAMEQAGQEYPTEYLEAVLEAGPLNVENVEYMIGIMKDAYNLDMQCWQLPALFNGKQVDNIEDLHQCGNTACFAGYMAISPKFKAEGGGILLTSGSPELVLGEDRLYGTEAVSVWLGIPYDLANSLVCGGFQYKFGPTYNAWPAGLGFGDIEPLDVIEMLNNLKMHGAEYFLVHQ